MKPGIHPYRIAVRIGLSVRTRLEVTSRTGQSNVSLYQRLWFWSSSFFVLNSRCTTKYACWGLLLWPYSLRPFYSHVPCFALRNERTRMKRCPACMCRTTPMAVSTPRCLTCWNWACNGEATDPYEISGKVMHQKWDSESPVIGSIVGKGGTRPASSHLLVPYLRLLGGCLSCAQVSDCFCPSCILTSDDQHYLSSCLAWTALHSLQCTGQGLTAPNSCTNFPLLILALPWCYCLTLSITKLLLSWSQIC